MTIKQRTYFEVRPGLDTLRYLVSYGLLTLLSKRAVKRPKNLFTDQIGSVDRHIISEGVFEKGVLEILADLIALTGRNQLMIDIGANIGNHTVALADLFERVESVEPNPVLYHVLMANARRNGLDHVTCHEHGIGAEDGEAVLAEPEGNHALGRVQGLSHLSAATFGKGEETVRHHKIQLKSAAAFLAPFGAMLDRAFIKIDVEGMEQEIIAAMLPQFVAHKPLVAFEWFTREQAGLTRILLDLDGYELWGIHAFDSGRNLLWRAAKMIVQGRRFALRRIDPAALDPFYPLALLIPTGTLSGVHQA